MKKQFLAALAALLFAGFVSAQTLATYGNDTITLERFLAAYNKNNAAESKDPKAVQKYLDLYITSRLKIKEATEMGYDTLPQMVADLQSLRAQLMPAFITDEESMNKLVAEAFLRSQKDIHLAHIFIAAGSDSVTARKKADEAYKKIMSGVAFSDVAKAYSDDPSAKINGGDAGFVTVFTLPYPLENLIYNTPQGKASPVFRSKAGYHIFKNLEERKALGKLKASQILIAYPPNASASVKTEAKRKADSLYNRLLKGDDFAKLATAFSNDVISAASGGVMPEISVGQYDLPFEKVVYALKGGTLSKPFGTAHGWHIVKSISRVPVPAVKNAATVQKLKEKIESSDRIQYAQEALAKRVLSKAGHTVLPFSKEELFQYSDSVLNYRSGKTFNINDTTEILRIGNKTFTTNDWVSFAQSNLTKSDGSGKRPYSEILESFIPYAALEYYKSNLEAFNPAFKSQLEEFKDGNLFFEIMQRKIWGPAQADTAALLNYYNTHKAKYKWAPSAEAVVFYASDAAKAAAFRKELLAKPAAWKELLTNYADHITSDLNRYEFAQLPNGGTSPKAGTVTNLLINKADGTVSFAYILKVHPQSAPRSFAEARGMVIADYQDDLEKEWIKELKQKYPVTVYTAVLKTK